MLRNLFLVKLLIFICSSSVFAASFQSLNDWMGTTEGLFGVNNMSDDGRVVIGLSFSCGNKAFKWESSGITDLGTNGESSPSCISSNGSVIGGNEYFFSTNRGFRWEGGTLTYLTPLTEGQFCYVTAVSAEGSVLAGESGPSACLWTGVEPISLGCLSGYDRARNPSISSDGTTVVGYCEKGLGNIIYEAFRWKDNQMDPLGFLPGHATSIATSVSGNGEIVVGYGWGSPGTNEAFRWENGQMMSLGLPEGFEASWAEDISDDGAIVVGRIRGNNESSASIWDPINGNRDLKVVLESDYSLDLNGWELESAFWVSGDGTLILGRGDGPNGEDYWVAEIPEPATISFLSLGGLFLRKMRRKR